MIALYYSFRGRVDTGGFSEWKNIGLERNVNFLRNLRIISRTLAAIEIAIGITAPPRHSRKGDIAWRKSRKSVVPSPPLFLSLSLPR